MEVRKLETKRTIFNTTLAKISGLYQILDSEFPKIGNHNVYGVVHIVLALFSFIVSAMLLINGVYFTKLVGHKIDTVMAIFGANTFGFSCYKMFIVVYRSNDILDCLSISQFDFTSLGHRHTSILDLWRNRSIKYTDLYAYTCYLSVILYSLSPLWFRDELRTVTAIDGSASYYRNNVLNLYSFFSAEDYNAYFFIMYLIESTCMLSFGYFTVMFDTLLAELCLSFICQLKMINATLESFGHGPNTHSQNPSNTDDNNIESKTTDEQSEVYSDLVTIIKEYQAIIQKLEKLFSIFGSIVLSQIFVSSSTLVVVWFVLIKKFTDEDIQTNPGETIIIAKMIIACPPLTFELFMSCCLFQFMSDEKESIVHSLYCSNWTEMDMKYRNLIMLTMKMNNAHKKKLKYSQSRVVNLELFLVTMRIGYSILSVMLKT